ncbi:autotransporter strand-loop-strand O-heptosyltransferase [Acetobacteraceae bacterium ESL0709]|nr:autotransporter strand-loop-strand O-heptosyltransferase [Acetobacteraceae bacterium ESL0697]MDF7678935.1 autotransporter strand-loop-strand O-heptosyltransferase [Acetobacteraceae bacterium ESL0709]
MTETKTDRILQNIIHLKGEDFAESGAVSDASKGNDSADSASNQDAGTAFRVMEGTPFPEPAPVMTQEGPEGIRYDFNAGIRLYVPKGNWKIRFKDVATQSLIYEKEGGDVQILSIKRHFMQARIEVEKDGKPFWAHDYDAAGKKVAVIMPGGTLGDTLGWFPYAVRFARQHKCELTVTMVEPFHEMFKSVYPDIRFTTHDEFEDIRDEFYATYYIGLFFHDEQNRWQPADFRMVGLHRTAGYILGVDPTEEPPDVYIKKADKRPIAEPYVVIAVQASAACKYWNNPTGWLDVVSYLKEKGYRVICIDKEPIIAYELSWNTLPYGAEDETGERPLSERARWIKHADFFIGLSSGLSWLAWAVGTPVVMISGFTHPTNEFNNPYRVFSTHVCNSCWHDIRTPFDHSEYTFCPRHKGTPRQFECTKAISANYVIATIERLCKDYKISSPKGRETKSANRKK